MANLSVSVQELGRWLHMSGKWSQTLQRKESRHRKYRLCTGKTEAERLRV
jgi:hypothetical protein